MQQRPGIRKLMSNSGFPAVALSLCIHYTILLISCFLIMPRIPSAPCCPGPPGFPDGEVEFGSCSPGAKRTNKSPLDQCSHQMLGFLQMHSHEVESVLECLQCQRAHYLEGQHIPPWSSHGCACLLGKMLSS